ncbi:hypothetical protein B296_00036315 [Ensete ventricosum]|uniref:Uncharacterized protein n=1 Tax=Ensete ventricosum TaxID=4639 RepID=A0A427A2Z1_ENSVE|nr:hypothetical protein B296_00036315 [Ensete ventricosum]
MQPPVCILFLLISCFHLSSSTRTFDAIFNFGDSLSDTGNFLIANANAFPAPNIGNTPYGMTFFGHPTGRCSDGRLIIDFFAEAFGLPLLPPFLSRNQSFARGVNFAVAGATALDVSFFEQRGLGGMLGTNLSLNVQLGWFEQLIPSLCNTTEGLRQLTFCYRRRSPRRRPWKLFGKSLFLVGEIGGNDYLVPLTSHRLTLEQVTAYVPTVVEAINNATERLIKRGAVNLVVPGHPPSGCFSGILALLNGTSKGDFEHDTGCLKKANDLLKYHNRLLHEEVVRLRRKYPHVRISYADFYKPIIRFARFPGKFGGPYNFNIQALCGLPGSSACASPSAAMNWDGWHTTEASYRQIAASWLHGPYAHPPIMSLMKD